MMTDTPQGGSAIQGVGPGNPTTQARHPFL
jgi:hypothetical protein